MHSLADAVGAKTPLTLGSGLPAPPPKKNPTQEASLGKTVLSIATPFCVKRKDYYLCERTQL